MTEYILLLAMVALFYVALTSWISKYGLAEKLLEPINGRFAAIYRFGHPLAKGFDGGSPEYHPRADTGGTNFRLFLNPTAK